ncbi:uncharacterized protein LOC129673126 [Psammomys obesus]|uniref:uncharacterized protein LOC129673126 n=1 Tax=Psammomys obesus TaxID=48139 RepID=UPI0024530198|nr:uncharacterized protein LOC129673126 [Psammomys obesus]
MLNAVSDSLRNRKWGFYWDKLSTKFVEWESKHSQPGLEEVCSSSFEGRGKPRVRSPPGKHLEWENRDACPCIILACLPYLHQDNWLFGRAREPDRRAEDALGDTAGPGPQLTAPGAAATPVRAHVRAAAPQTPARTSIQHARRRLLLLLQLRDSPASPRTGFQTGALGWVGHVCAQKRNECHPVLQPLIRVKSEAKSTKPPAKGHMWGDCTVVKQGLVEGRLPLNLFL